MNKIIETFSFWLGVLLLLLALITAGNGPESLWSVFVLLALSGLSMAFCAAFEWSR